MLAHPRHSVVVLLNPSRGHAGVPEKDAHGISLALLEAGCRLFGVTPLAVGDGEPQASAAGTLQVFERIPLDGLVPWKDPSFTERMAQDDLRFLYLAGA